MIYVKIFKTEKCEKTHKVISYFLDYEIDLFYNLDAFCDHIKLGDIYCIDSYISTKFNNIKLIHLYNENKKCFYNICPHCGYKSQIPYIFDYPYELELLEDMKKHYICHIDASKLELDIRDFEKLLDNYFIY